MSNDTPITVADLPLLPDYSSNDFELIGRGTDLYKRAVSMNPTVAQVADLSQRMTYQESELNQVQALVANDVGHAQVAADLQAQVLRIDANFNSIDSLENRVGVLEAHHTPPSVDTHTKFQDFGVGVAIEYHRIRFAEGFSLVTTVDANNETVGTLHYSAADDVEPDLCSFVDPQGDPVVPQPAPVTKLRTYIWDYSDDHNSLLNIPMELHPDVFICSVVTVEIVGAVNGVGGSQMMIDTEFVYLPQSKELTVSKRTTANNGYVVIKLAGRGA